MATAKAATLPGYTRIDPQPKKIYTDEALNEVSAGSPRAAFSFLPHDLERLRARREELGFDDRARAAKASQEAELKIAKLKLVAMQANYDQLEAQVKESRGSTKDEKETDSDLSDSDSPKAKVKDINPK